MKEEAIQKALTIDGLMQPEELSVIYDLVTKYAHGGNVFETGTFKGRTSCLIAEVLKERGGSLTTIDCYDREGDWRGEYEGYDYEDTVNNLKDYPIKIVKGRFRDVLEQVTDCDMAFLDGDHSPPGIRLELAYFSSFTNVIAGHDWSMVEGEITRFIGRHPEFKLENFNTIYGLWCLSK